MLTPSDVFLSIRKFFGFLVPGFTWVVLLVLLVPSEVAAFLKKFQATLSGPVALYAAALTLSYFIGTLATQLSFRLLAILNNGIDFLTSRLRVPLVRPLIAFLSRRLQIFNLRTMREEFELFNAHAIPLPGIELSVNAGVADRSSLYKLCVLEQSSALAKELLELEGEINFYGGMCAPTAVAGTMLVQAGHPAGWVVLAVAVYLGLRFQFCRHYEIGLIDETSRALAAKLKSQH